MSKEDGTQVDDGAVGGGGPLSDPPGGVAGPDRLAAPGGGTLWRIALPLILSQSFATVQVTVDRVLLSWHDPAEVAAAFPAMMLFWLVFGLLQGTAAYVATFVAQYVGAGRPQRVGPAVWQGLYFAVVAGAACLAVMGPAAPLVVDVTRPPQELASLETVYLRWLSLAAVPMLLVAAVSGFFTGCGRTWIVLGIDAVGTAVNVAASGLLIFGVGDLPEMGIAGAGAGTVIGAWVSAVTGLGLFWRRRERELYHTLRGWWPEPELMRRLLRYGGPAGVQMFLDVLAFTLFTLLIGQLGVAAMAATSITITLNMFSFLPLIGLGQAISILVGQYVGADRPADAERITWLGFCWALGYIVVIATVYVLFPQHLLALFAPSEQPELFAEVARLVPTLLACVAVYSLADAGNLTFAFALRGAGDTRFVSFLTFALAWPVMVLPTWALVRYREVLVQRVPGMGEPLFWAWGCATAYIILMAVCFWLRFRHGRWKQMRVIEPAPPVP